MNEYNFQKEPIWQPNEKSGERMKSFIKVVENKHGLNFSENREVERMTFKELHEETRIYAAAFKKLGLQTGDIVTCYMSNRIEAVVAMLAVTSIGAVWTGGLPILGANAYLSRVKQVEPQFLFTIDKFPHNKETIYLLNNIKEIADELPSLKKVIIVPSTKDPESEFISKIKNSCFLDEFKSMAYNEDGTLPELTFEQVSFSHPAFISYTSGTTGLPKVIVHGFGGLLTTFRDFGLHWNCERNDVWLSMSAVGWASWNLAVNLLFIGSSVVLFEGVPYFLSPTYLWDLVDELKLTRLFITPTILDGLEDKNYVPNKKHNLSSLKTIITGGSVVKPRNYIFVLNKIKEGLEFVTGCGSTEVMGFCLVNEQMLPVYVGEISSPSLGVAFECLDNEGNYLLGEMGEFVVSKPMPSLPLKLWGDVNGEQYRKTYFSKFAGKFAIGDSIMINPLTKDIIICGRSDETLKQRGCRFGCSEIYNVVKLFPEINDCLCIGQYNKDREERAVLFIEMKPGSSFNKNLIARLRKCIASELTERHVPELILQAPGIPYNANGKKTEIIIKKIINKMPHNTETVVNSECLQFYYNVPEIEEF